MIYPYNAPIILTDQLFSDYGGDNTKGTSNQRKAAFRLAEIEASNDLSTFLLPTIVTGSYHAPFYNPLILEHSYINSISIIRFLDEEGDIYYSITGTNSIYASLRDNTYGIVDIHHLFGSCNCHSNSHPYPYQVQIVYNTGLSSGTSYQPDILLALTTYADIIMNEIVGYGNEAPGDVGISEFSNQDYSEKRRIKNTTFGASPRAVFASKLFNRLRKRRFVSL